MKFETKVIHAGQEPDPRTGAVMTPIYATLDLRPIEPGRAQGIRLREDAQPHARRAGSLPRRAGGREGGLRLRLRHGRDRHRARASTRLACGGDERSLRRQLPDTRARAQALGQPQRDVYGSFRSKNLREEPQAEYADGVGREPTNPLLKIVDLEAVAAIARKHKLISVCDNTFASPWIQRPLELGFDIVVHSDEISERPFGCHRGAAV